MSMRVHAASNPFSRYAEQNVTVLFAGKSKRGKHVADIELEDKKGKKVEGDLYTKTDNDNPDLEIYDIWVKRNHVGHMELDVHQKGELGNFPNYGKHVYVDWVGSGNKLEEGDEQNTRRGDCPYVGVGTTLIQVAYERSVQRGLDGRVGLYALNAARDFYLKRGFKRASRSTNRYSFNNYTSNNMALEKSGRRYWKRIVAKNPILEGKQFKAKAA